MRLSKKVLCFVNIFILMVSFIKPVTYAKTQKEEEKKQKYIIQTDNTSKYSKMKREFKNNKEIVINHKDSDEKYLVESQSVVAEITKEEAETLSAQSDVIVEKDYTVTADSREKRQPVQSAIPIEMSIDKVSSEEYASDPTKFKPCKPVNDLGKMDEVVPWNIDCVAGTPSKNKYHGKHVKVAIIDSGIDVHDELNTKGWVDFSDKVDGYKPTDNSGHGTSMAGVIAARVNGIGFEGIASESELYSVKVLDKENTASVSTIIKAIEWCIENKIDIINMSFGMDQYSVVLAEEISKAFDNGILLIASAGNDAKKIQYPAAYPEVISVGSIDKDLKESVFSKNQMVDLVAPGEEVQTTGFVGSYSITEGTSIAAAHVTGVAAAIKSARKHVTNEMLKNVLLSSGIILKDGSHLVNYQNAVATIKDLSPKKISVTKLQKEVANLAEDKEAYVEGSWTKDNWLDGSAMGHYSMINSMDSSYFAKGASNETERWHNRWIAADADYRADFLPLLSADSTGNYRDTSGNVTTKGNGGTLVYSPYHAKSEYSLYEVVQHLNFLYELARRRLILGSNLELKATNYNGNSYYSVSIPLIMKRRIIVDLNVLYNDLSSHYINTGVNINKVTSKGYMVLGLMFHLVQDMQAHRAKITKDMLFTGSNADTYYKYDQMGYSAAECRINGNNMLGSSARSILYNEIKSNGSIPIIRLKDFYSKKEGFKFRITVNGKEFSCSPAQAYEDNPYFYRRRYDTAVQLSREYVDYMDNDKGNTSTLIGCYISFADLPLYENRCYKFK